MENEHGPRALADDEVALPMAGFGSGVDSLRPFMDGDPIFDRISRGPRLARTPASVTARQITPELFGLLVSAVDEGVDRFATHRPQTAFVSRFQPTRDLLGRPSFRKTVADESPQFLIFFEDGFTPPAQLIGSGGEAANNARSRGRCAAVPATRWISLGEAPWRWRRSSGRPPS